jgi:hypothetical protein
MKVKTQNNLFLDRMSELSELILDLLHRAYMTVSLEFVDENVFGEQFP